MNDKQSLTIDDLPVESSNTYIVAATSDNTRKSYQSDINHFMGLGFKLPASAEAIEQYLKLCANEYNPRTLVRRMTALRQWHRFQGLDDPTVAPVVRKTMQGIARLHGKPKKQALALRLEDLDKISEYLVEQGGLADTRNRALILVCFFGAFRRSELVGLQWEQVRFVNDGMIITLPRSKTDQVGEGARCVIPFGNNERCPVQALLEWRNQAKLWGGAVFRRLSKTGTISDKAISSDYCNRLLRQIIKGAGIPNAELYSAHSLRRGFATEAARLGASMPSIQRHGRWQTTRIVVEYIEAGRQFADSAVKVLFDF